LAESQIELTLILPSSSMFLSVGKQISEMLNKGFQERPNFAVVVGEDFVVAVAEISDERGNIILTVT
jgi:hypothetical protein